MALTKKYMTEENLELHMASNHFGHFLLANLLAPLMVKSAVGQSEPGRIVTVSSVGHWWGKIELDDLNSERCAISRHNNRVLYFARRVGLGYLGFGMINLRPRSTG